MLRAFIFMVVAAVAAACAVGAGAQPKAFKDCSDCPQMVVVPGGAFRMGQELAGQARSDEQPVHEVTLQSFAAGRTEVTRAEFAAYAKDTGFGAPGPCTTDSDHDGRWALEANANWMDPGVPTSDRHPVTCVNWADAVAYTDWLSAKTGKHYRLLSEAEWEYAERAGSTTEYWWGDKPEDMCRFANGPDLAAGRTFPNWPAGANCDDGSDFAAPVASYAANAFGLFDTAGNVWEWTADCYAPYTMQPPDGTPTLTGKCVRRVLRGGSWVRGLVDLRSSQRNGLPRPEQRGGDIGFRVARDL